MLTFGGQTFKNKTELRAYISKAINYKGRVIGKPFTDEVLADLFYQQHHRWRGHRPEYFVYIQNEEGDGRTWGDSLAAYLPGEGDCRFKSSGLLCSRVDIETKFPGYCRERFTRVWRDRLFLRAGTCNHPDCTARATDVDHIKPQHIEIVNACWVLLSDQDKQAWWKKITEGDGEHFQLPEGHPVTQEYDRLTEAGSYQVLCGYHHAKISGLRSRKDSDVVPVEETFSDPGLDALFT